MENFFGNLTTSERTLQRYCKAKGYDNPIYKVVSRSSARIGNVIREKYYTVSVSVNAIQLAVGDGMSKRIARMKCATWGMQKLRILELHQLMTGYQRAIPEMASIRGFTQLAISASAIDQPQITAAVSQILYPRIEEIPRDCPPVMEEQTCPKQLEASASAKQQEAETKPERRESVSSADAIIEALEHFVDDGAEEATRREEERRREISREAFDRAQEAIDRAREDDTHESYSNAMNDIQELISEAAKGIETFDEEDSK